MESAIITGTGIYEIPGFQFNEQVIDTPYGQAAVYLGKSDGFELAFLPRHGLAHSTPPHKINFRANIKALKILGVKFILATNAVGSINPKVLPMSLALLSDFLDFTSGRKFTFFEGGESGLAHTNMDHPYCPSLSQHLLDIAPKYDLSIYPEATYVATNGPRFESPAEIKMYDRLGGDVVGMTGIPEVVLAKELGMHYASIAYSINWAAGIEEEMIFVSHEMQDIRQRLAFLLVEALRSFKEPDCNCENAVMMMHSPKPDA